MYAKAKRLKAFSLIELSIVIIIIGILIAGISQSDKLITLARLTSAKSATENTRAQFNEGSVLWLESTIETAFDPASAEDNAKVLAWYDSAFSRNNAKLAVPASTTAPIYKKSGINSLPALVFNGAAATGSANQALSFNGAQVAGSSFTVFVVEFSDSAATSDNCVLGSSVSSEGMQFCVNANKAKFVYGSSSVSSTPDVDKSGNHPRIHVLVHNATTVTSDVDGDGTATGNLAAQSVYYGGQSNTLTRLGSATISVPSYAGAVIGSSGTANFNGLIGEVVIFDKVMKDKDREKIITYLKRKWQI